MGRGRVDNEISLLSKFKRRKLNQNFKEESEQIFIAIWKKLETFGPKRQVLAVKWLLNDQDIMQIFVSHILEMPYEVNKGMFWNAYTNMKQSPKPFSGKVWKKICEVMDNKHNFCTLSKMLLESIRAVRDGSYMEHCKLSQMRVHELSLMSSDADYKVQQTKPALVKRIEGEYVYIEHVHSKTLQIGICISEKLVCRHLKNMTIFVEVGSGNIVAGWVHGLDISQDLRDYIRKYLQDLFSSHVGLRRSKKREAVNQMRGFGAYMPRWNKKHDRVEFYTHASKLSKMVGKNEEVYNFEDLIDRYCHLDLVEIILTLYVTYCPLIAEEFLCHHSPFLPEGAVMRNAFDECMSKMPSSYQLYVSRNFCSRMHSDEDKTPFTVAYASNPDVRRGRKPFPHFVLGKYGVVLPVGDSDLFAFRGADLHGTACKDESRNAVYVGALVINRKMGRKLDKCENVKESLGCV